MAEEMLATLRPIVTREEAKAAGLKRYFLGTPCDHGHVDERFVSSKGCVVCVAARRDDYRLRNPDQAREYTKAYYAKNREVVKEKRRDSYGMVCPTCNEPIEVRPQKPGAKRTRRPKFCSPRCRLEFMIDRTPGHGPNGDCWIAKGAQHKFGYVWINISESKNGVSKCAHVVSWELENGPVPKGMNVLHKCDYPPCCRPSHLFLGTSADNSADMVAKDRQAKGTQIPQSKLTEEDVRKILNDPRTQSEIAAEYGVIQQTISKLKSGKTWKHVK